MQGQKGFRVHGGLEDISAYAHDVLTTVRHWDFGVQSLLDFNAVRPLRTVFSLLEEREATRLLNDPLLERATAEIQTAGKSRPEIQRDIKAKERARETIARRLMPVV